MKKILVAIDFSAGSAQALHYAFKFARQFGSDLLLLHVIHDPAEAPGFYSSRKNGEPVFRNMEEAASAMMDDFVAEHLQEWKKFEVRIIPGLPADEIVRTAEKEKAEMIVVGTSGHSGLKRLMIGSVAESVIRASACPVLAVRSQGGSSQ